MCKMCTAVVFAESEEKAILQRQKANGGKNLLTFTRRQSLTGKENKMNDIQKLEMIGVAMFGEQWKSAIAKKLGVNDRTVRRWVAGDIQINQNIFVDLERALIQRQADLRLTLRVLRHGELFVGETVNIKHLKNALADECSNYSDMSSFSDFVDEWIQLNIEIPMAENAGLDKIKDSIYDYIGNVDALRDCQNDFVSEILENKNA